MRVCAMGDDGAPYVDEAPTAPPLRSIDAAEQMEHRIDGFTCAAGTGGSLPGRRLRSPFQPCSVESYLGTTSRASSHPARPSFSPYCAPGRQDRQLPGLAPCGTHPLARPHRCGHSSGVLRRSISSVGEVRRGRRSCRTAPSASLASPAPLRRRDGTRQGRRLSARALRF